MDVITGLFAILGLGLKFVKEFNRHNEDKTNNWRIDLDNRKTDLDEKKINLEAVVVVLIMFVVLYALGKSG